jgi:hypothetical protein
MPERPSPSTPSDATLVTVLGTLAEAGYTADFFVTADALVRCGRCHRDVAPAEMRLEGLRRLEGASDPADMAAVLAVACTHCGAKGTAVVRYGPEAEPQDEAVLLAVDDRRFPSGS